MLLLPLCWTKIPNQSAELCWLAAASIKGVTGLSSQSADANSSVLNIGALLHLQYLFLRIPQLELPLFLDKPKIEFAFSKFKFSFNNSLQATPNITSYQKFIFLHSVVGWAFPGSMVILVGCFFRIPTEQLGMLIRRRILKSLGIFLVNLGTTLCHLILFNYFQLCIKPRPLFILVKRMDFRNILTFYMVIF